MSIYAHHGKIKYCVATMPEGGWEYSYSAEQLQRQLSDMVVGQKLSAIYVGLDGYLESMHNDTNVIDLSYMGGTILVLYEKIALQLEIHVEGMVEYRYFPIWEVRLRTVFDYPPDDMVLNDTYFYDIANHDITFRYQGERVTGVAVRGTDSWGFSQPHFDSVKAAEAAAHRDLPTEIVIYTKSCAIRFVGDELEYFWVILEEPDTELREAPK